MNKNFRAGAVGALLDEYELAIAQLKIVIENMPDSKLTVIIDPLTLNDNCRSVQTILSHVVNSGYGYAVSINNLNGPVLVRPGKTFHVTKTEYLHDLNNLFAFTEQVFLNVKDIDLEQLDDTKKIKVYWGQLYDVEQLMEHAIVHILRHRRQIEKFNCM